MINYLKYFFNPSHLFSLRPQAMEARAVIILAVVFGALIIISLGLFFLINKTKDGLKVKGYRRLSHLFLGMGISGLAYLFFAWQGIAILGSRFWLLVWLLVLVIWLFFIVKYLLREVPKLRREIEEKRSFSKYIP
ncbi:MAG: hypothetical protein WCW26_01100 [Candidatus Buchananbacteria bacterium]